jgi:four helix bundle protein
MRDHRKLEAFQLADELVFSIYKTASSWPKEERFGLTSQIQRAGVSVVSNIVEGSARATNKEYARFLEIAFASAREMTYQLSLARRLEWKDAEDLEQRAERVCRIMSGLVRARSD